MLLNGTKVVYRSKDMNRVFKNKEDRNSDTFSLHPPVLKPRTRIIETCEPTILELLLWRYSGRNLKLNIHLRVYFYC
jgi:hypothetical protein